MACEPNLACCLLLYGWQTKDGFYIFKWLERKAKRIFHELYEIQISVSINKVLWEIAPPIHFHIVYGCFGAAVIAKKIIWTAKPKVFTIWPFIEKVCQSLVQTNRTRTEREIYVRDIKEEQ